MLWTQDSYDFTYETEADRFGTGWMLSRPRVILYLGEEANQIISYKGLTSC